MVKRKLIVSTKKPEKMDGNNIYVTLGATNRETLITSNERFDYHEFKMGRDQTARRVPCDTKMLQSDPDMVGDYVHVIGDVEKSNDCEVDYMPVLLEAIHMKSKLSDISKTVGS